VTVHKSASILALLCVALAAGSPRAAHAQAMSGPNETPSHQPKLTKAPKLLHFEEAAYPESEKAAGKTASVVLQIAITDKGTVEDVVVVGSAGPAFDEAALAAVRNFTFEPAEIDGKPAPVKLTYRYDFVFKIEPVGPIVNLDGVVLDRFKKKPLPGVVIKLAGIGETKTDEQGKFDFKDVPPGTYNVTIEGQGLTTVSTEEKVEEKKKTTVKYLLEPKEENDGEGADLEIVVVGQKIKKEVVSTEIKVEEGRRVPGTQGDTLKVVQNLPGVARAAFGSGQLVVWGAAPQDTRVYVDGVHIPLLYHGGGLRSTVNSDMVRAIDLAPGGYGPDFGRGLGGLVTIDTRPPRSDRIHGYAAADAIDASAMVEAPIGSSTRVAVAGRKSYLDKALNLFTSKDVGEFVPIPSYYDAQLKISHDLRENESVELFGLLSSDDLQRTVTSPDPAETKRENTQAKFARLLLSYKRQLEGQSISVVPSIGHDSRSDISQFGGMPAELSASGTSFGLRTTWRGKLSEHINAMAGLDLEGGIQTVYRQGATTLPPREGDIHVFGQPAGDQVNVDTWETRIGSAAPFGQLDFTLLDGRLHVVPGMRIDPYIISGDKVLPAAGDQPFIGYTHENTAYEPRLSVRLSATEALSVRAAWGIYHQAPEPDDLSAVFGNPKLDVSQATHYLAGVAYRLPGGLTLETVGFYAHSTDLVARSQLNTPVLAEGLVQDGEGRAYGGQVLLRREIANGFFGWISYSLIRSQRRDHPDLDWRLFDYDQTHVATLVASYELGAGFEVGTRFRYATGFPRTPVVGAFYDARRDLYEPFFGDQNSIRIPAFVQLDVRASKRFTFGDVKAEVYVDVQNVTNKRNPEDVVYSYDYTKRGYITGLPILPVAGGRIEW
jgi:TonB family protein